MEITREILAKKHGDKAAELFAEIALLGGFGQVGVAEQQLNPDCALDLRGILDPSHEGITDKAKARIKAIVGGEAPKAETK